MQVDYETALRLGLNLGNLEDKINGLLVLIHEGDPDVIDTEQLEDDLLDAQEKIWRIKGDLAIAGVIVPQGTVFLMGKVFDVEKQPSATATR